VRVKTACALANSKGRFLYEILPDLFPQRFFSLIEMEVWALYFAEQARRERKA
jgi:hypothetical protein